MENETPSEITQAITGLQREAASLRSEIERATIRYRDCVPVYNEPATTYEKRKAEAAAALDNALRRASHWRDEAGPQKAAIQKRLDGPDGMSLSASDWQTASAAASLATQMMSDSPLDQTVAQLRSVLAGGNKGALFAHVVAAENRLRRPAPTSDGKVPMVDVESERALRTLIGEARALLRDRSLDRTRESLREANVAASDLILAENRARKHLAADEPVLTAGTGPNGGKVKVPWPTDEELEIARRNSPAVQNMAREFLARRRTPAHSTVE